MYFLVIQLFHGYDTGNTQHWRTFSKIPILLEVSKFDLDFKSNFHFFLSCSFSENKRFYSCFSPYGTVLFCFSPYGTAIFIICPYGGHATHAPFFLLLRTPTPCCPARDRTSPFRAAPRSEASRHDPSASAVAALLHLATSWACEQQSFVQVRIKSHSV